MSIIDDYMRVFDSATQAEFNRIRKIAKTMLPECEETISYGMPTIKYKGVSIIGFDAHKNHIGIYPFSGAVIPKISELRSYSTTKGAIQEKLEQTLPDMLIQKIIQTRLEQADLAQ